MRYHIASTVSTEAAAGRNLDYQSISQMARPTGPPASLDEWDARNAQLEEFARPLMDAGVSQLDVSVREQTIGGVKVYIITPSTLKKGCRLIYLHGGAYVFYSARTLQLGPAMLAMAMGVEVISIEYTLAPRSTWRSTTGEVLTVYRSLLDKGLLPGGIGIFGDSAGGGLAAGSILRMRDEDLMLPGALYLISPWSDITATGDSYTTLASADPSLTEEALQYAADAYAAREHQRHPYVSPVYGDYAKPFPPTLIQGGTREIFLSHFVRHYQAIRQGGHEAVLDLYEGMPHVFQTLVPASPETKVAMRRAADFLESHLDCGWSASAV